MSSLFDDNNEEERQEQKLYEFYEVFSLEVGRQLLAKNLPVIQNVYDVLYPQTKNTLLSKNVTSDITIDSTAESVRNALVAKLVEENINIDTISENFRKQLLSKNVLADSSRELQNKIDQVRKNLLSKNKNSNPNTIDSVSDSQRRDSLSKNKESLNKDKEIERDNISFRESNLSKNAQSENTLDEQSAEFRKNNIHKNVDSSNDLDRQGQQARDNNLAKNATFQNNKNELDTIANERRKVDESRSVPKESQGLDVDSEGFRDNNIAKNVIEETSLEDSSSAIRDNNLSKNDSSDGDLLEDSSSFRKQDLSKNVQSTSDLLTDSEGLRKDDLSKNTPTESNLLDSSEEARLNDLSKNDESKNDLLVDSELLRKDDLSKNTSIVGDLLVDSEGVRDNNLSSNTTKASDISVDSESFRKDNLSKNALTESDLELGSEDYRIDDLSKNKPNESDLFADSSEVRNDNVSKNVETGGDLLTDSTVVRDDSLSKTVPVVTSLEVLSQDPREDLLGKNTPNPSDLLDRGLVPREDLLAANVPSTSELLSDSQPFRDDLLAINVPVATDLLFDSEPFRDNVLSENVPTTTDLLNDSVPYYANNLSANVPTQYDILDASQTFLDANLASNNSINSDLLNDSYEILQDNLAPNVPTDSDLLNDSQTYLTDNLASNVPNTSDLLAESLPIRNDLIASNQPSDSDLLNDSTIYRDNLVAQNDNAELGVTFEGFGTFSYLGVSKVALQGLVIRSFLKSKNQPNPLMDFDQNNPISYSETALSRNDYVLKSSEYDRSTAILLTGKVDPRGFPLKGYPSAYPDEDLSAAISRQMGENRFYTDVIVENLQSKYGIQDKGDKTTSLGGGYFGVDTINPQGGSFQLSNKAGSVAISSPGYVGSTTQAIRKYNVARNIYNLVGIQNLASMTEAIGVLNSNNDLGFQDLINKTIGAFHTPNNSISAQAFGNLIPSSVLETNNNLYLRKSAEEMMGRNEPTDPQLKASWIGTPESMMQKTIAGNPLQEPAFDTAQRGVKHIMKSIRNNPKVKMSVNYDPQNTTKYVIKETKEGVPTYASQRFTIANPYSPPSAKSLTFSLKNYSSGDVIYLPPYIDSFSDSHTANWNEINFLGRPEPIYTYNNSKRDGSISFFVLTDFSEIVLMGREWSEPDMNKIEKPISASFSDKASYNVAGAIFDASGLIEQYGVDNEKIKELIDFKAAQNTSTTVSTTGQTEAAQAGDTPANNTEAEPETAEQTEYQKILSETKINLENQINTVADTLDEDLIYALASETNKNIYDFMTSKSTPENGEISSTPGDTLKRLDEMIQGTIFQPAYFSGSKVDFINRMDFLAKLTKPAKASAGSGYSFTSPPVARIKLGNWWNHDIVVKTVSVDHTDSPWTLDKGRVQPLWAKVTISFDFVGRYGGEGAPVLSTDFGGVYSP
jgi:predicted amino acid-binding ACT domain protein